ncbi:MAG: preprotein translocase subunit SecG [Bacteroidetes bacterium]|nr:preprotein translocase subunit SecG [Bacteroidota bacterium]
MGLLFGLLVTLIAIVSVLLVGAVLLQSGKGDGLAGMGASTSQQILGARQAPDFIQKATWALGSTLLFLCLLTGFVVERPGQRAPVSAPTQAAPAPAATPATPGASNGTATPAPAGNAAPAPAPAAPQN